MRAPALGHVSALPSFSGYQFATRPGNKQAFAFRGASPSVYRQRGEQKARGKESRERGGANCERRGELKVDPSNCHRGQESAFLFCRGAERRGKAAARASFEIGKYEAGSFVLGLRKHYGVSRLFFFLLAVLVLLYGGFPVRTKATSVPFHASRSA